MPKRVTQLQVGAKTDVGQKRDHNEDQFGVVEQYKEKAAWPLAEKKGNLYIVADGMGGHNAGEVASRLAVDIVAHEYYRDDSPDVETSLRQAIAHTYGMIEMIDDCVGRIFAALDKSGLQEDTIILFSSDHGELLGDHGLLHKGPPPYRQLLEVPLLIKGPAIASGHTIHALTSHLDLTPSLLDLAGIRSEDPAFDGQSIMPLLRGAQNSIRDALFAENHPRGVYDLYNQTILTDHWRLTRYPQHPQWGEFFDRTHDPFEHRNLFHEPGSSATIEMLKKIFADRFPPKPTVNARRIAKW